MMQVDARFKQHWIAPAMRPGDVIDDGTNDGADDGQSLPHIEII
jgi:hypothetical protein